MKNYILLILFISSLGFSAKALEILESPFALKILAKDFYAKLIKEKYQSKRNISLKWASQKIDTQIPIEIKNAEIQFHIDSKWSPYHLERHNLVASVSLSNLFVQIDEVKVDHVWTQEVGGNRIRTRVAGVCKGIRLELPKSSHWLLSASMKAADDQISLENRKLHLFSLPGEFPFQISSCSGVEGAREFLHAKLAEMISDIAFVESLSSKLLNEYLDSELLKLQKAIFSLKKIAASERFSVYIKPVSVEFIEGGSFLVSGQLYSYLGNSLDATYLHTKISEDLNVESLGRGSSSEFYIPKKLIETVVGQLYKNQVLQIDSQTDSIPALKSLMGSRFKQYYVWRDFRNFPEKTNLKFTHLLSSEPVLKNTDYKTPNRIASEIQSSSRFVMKMPRDNQYLDYAYLDVSLDLKVDLIPTRGKIEFICSVQSINTQHAFYPSYLEKYKVTNKVSHSRIRKEMTKMLNSSNYSLENPALQLWEFSHKLLWQSHTLVSPNIIAFELKP